MNNKVYYCVVCGYAGTLYYFGDNDRDGWRELFDKYKFPPYKIPNLKPEISFGMAGRLVCVLLECFIRDVTLVTEIQKDDSSIKLYFLAHILKSKFKKHTRPGSLEIDCMLFAFNFNKFYK